MDLTLIIPTFIAGIVMFLAPCTLPLIPAYLGFISGLSCEELSDPALRARTRRRVVASSVLFTLGFSLVFIAFGLLAGLVGAYVGPLRMVLTKVAGVLIILFGLLLIGVYREGRLIREYRVRLPASFRIGAPSTSFLLGAAFAFGWTPCIGPILATVLLFASSTETMLSGMVLLMVFSAGFSIPFILLGALLSQATALIDRLAPYLRAVSIIGGVLLVLLGTSLLFGNLAYLTSTMFRVFGALDYEEHIMRFL